jgi:hypothetical protein
MNNVVFYRYLVNHKDELEFEDFRINSKYDAEVQFFTLRRNYFFSVLENFNIVTDENSIGGLDSFTLAVGFDPSFKELFHLIEREDFNSIVNTHKDRIKKIVFWEMDTGWTNYGQEEYDEKKAEFKKWFDERGIEYVIFSTAIKFRYDSEVKYFPAHNAMVIERLVKELTDNGYYDYVTENDANKYFYCTSNSLNVDRAHFYKYITDYNLWDCNNVALFSTYRNVFTDHQYDELGWGFNYSYIVALRGGGNLHHIDDSFKFYAKPFSDENFQTMNYSVLSNYDRVRDSLFEMVFETIYEANEDLIVQTSEKTFKPFVHKKPFLIFSYTGIWKELKELGFKSFEYMFDETSDEMPNANDRLYDVMDEFKRICNKPIGELNQIVRDNYKTQEYNFKVMNELFIKWRKGFTDAVKYE